MARKTVDISSLFKGDDDAQWVANLWTKWNNQRQGKLRESLELRNYLFATDTTTTTNASLPWKNSTTLPKLTQLRDNLHANYWSALFPNSQWLKWESTDKSPNAVKKARTIRDYILNKTSNSQFELEVSKLLHDWIDYGNCFGKVEFERKVRTNAVGKEVVDYVGPRLYRISPLDIVFNPLANSFLESPKVVRTTMSIGDLVSLVETNPAYQSAAKTVERRKRVINGGFTREDFDKAVGYSVDGFGSMYEYMTGDIVELLEFYGDFYNPTSGELLKNYHIVVADRKDVLIREELPTWLPSAPIFHSGWRLRTDNLWAMGPLDNLVGLQYRIDHLENLKADAMDLAVHPPLLVQGDVEYFEWEPMAKIHASEEGTVTELGKNLNGVITANNEINLIESRMEMYAGAPREAMGIRSPGEKTMFEVQQLENAAGRIFQSKIEAFQRDFLEPVLNAMFETAIRNFEETDIIRVMDTELGVEVIKEVTKDDLVASGKFRPIGARHYAAKALLMQNLTTLMNSNLANYISPHTSKKAVALLIEEVLGLDKFSIIRPYVALDEDAEQISLTKQLQESMAAEDQQPVL